MLWGVRNSLGNVNQMQHREIVKGGVTEWGCWGRKKRRRGDITAYGANHEADAVPGLVFISVRRARLAAGQAVNASKLAAAAAAPGAAPESPTLSKAKLCF